MTKHFIPAVTAFIMATGLFVAITCTYIVDEREQVVVTRFSKPVRVIVGERPPEELEALKQQASQRESSPSDVRIDMGAGLKFKMPFVDRIERFPDTLLEYDAEPERIITRDKKILIVDNFARWRIEDPLLFRISVRNEMRARERLDDIIYAVMREEIGRNDLIEVIRTTNRYLDDDSEEPAVELQPYEILSDSPPMRDRIERGREAIMEAVVSEARSRARAEYGIRIVDVRIKRADLVDENLVAVFGRMRAERERVSKAYSSEGEKEAEIIRGETDRRVSVTIANARREAEEIRGAADAEVVRIYAEAFGADPELYQFIRSLEVLRDALPPGTELILGAQSGIFGMLKDGPAPPGRRPGSPLAAAP